MILISIIRQENKMEDENIVSDDQNEEIKDKVTRLEGMVRNLVLKNEMEWREAKEKEKKYDWPPID